MAEFIGQLLLGWLLADLAGGLVHWAEDTGNLPAFLDRQIGAPNRAHHADPLSVTRDGNFLRRNWTTWAAAAPLLAGLELITGVNAIFFASTLGGLLSYEVHRWAHAPRLAPPFVRILQDIGVLQSPKQHARHHAPPHERSYCVLSDWLNPVLDASGVSRMLAGLRIASGHKPQAGTLDEF